MTCPQFEEGTRALTRLLRCSRLPSPSRAVPVVAKTKMPKSILIADVHAATRRKSSAAQLMSANNGLFPTLTRWAILTVVVATGLFLAAGTTHLPMLDAYVVALAPSLLVMMLAIDPQIAQERESEDKGTHDARDARARLALVGLFLATILTAALDVGRAHLSNDVPLALGVVALLLYIGGSGFQAWAMSVNSFYSPVIHVQPERGHSVVTRGPYRMLRHPAYFANIVAIPASALAIGSWIALIPAIAFCALTLWRARREDAFLKQNLCGYEEYMKRVPGGVFPRLLV